MLWWTVPIDVGPLTWGDADNPPPAPADPRALVHAALHRNPGAWQALMPPDADQVVRLLPATPSDTDVTVHPMGLFDVRQHAVPLETVLTRVGANPVPEGQQRVHLGVPVVNATPAGALSEVTDLFSAGQLPRPQRSRQALAPELRADAGRRADPSARRGGRLGGVARGRPSATRRSSATTTTCEATGRWPSWAGSSPTCRADAGGRGGGAQRPAGRRPLPHEPRPDRAGRSRGGGEVAPRRPLPPTPPSASRRTPTPPSRFSPRTDQLVRLGGDA